MQIYYTLGIIGLSLTSEVDSRTAGQRHLTRFLVSRRKTACANLYIFHPHQNLLLSSSSDFHTRCFLRGISRQFAISGRCMSSELGFRFLGPPLDR